MPERPENLVKRTAMAAVISPIDVRDHSRFDHDNGSGGTVDNTALKTEQFSQSKARLVEWRAQNLTERFEHRVMPVDKRIALAWGDLMGDAKRSG